MTNPSLSLVWPDRPSCHDGDMQAHRSGPHTWLPAHVRRHPENDHIDPFRVCSFCGSMHPQDLVAAMEMGATVDAADFKYGWPHKFYIKGIPDPRVGEMRRVSSYSGGTNPDGTPCPVDDDVRRAYGFMVLRTNAHGQYWYGETHRPAPPTTHGKWYNAHLLELGDEALDLLTMLLHQQTGVMFDRQNGELVFRRVPVAPKVR